MLSENKFSKYLLYAIGEITLVVIGILIVLQVNNQNENKKAQREESELLQNLNQEFRKNKVEIEGSIQRHAEILSATKQLMRLIGEPEAVLDKYNIDSLLAKSIDYENYRPSQSVVSDIISSGKLKLITSDTLRFQIFGWTSEVEKHDESYKTLDEINQDLFLPYLTKHASLKNIDNYGILDWGEKSKLNHDNKNMFQELEFENLVDNQAWDIKNYLLALENLEKLITRIINETQPKK